MAALAAQDEGVHGLIVGAPDASGTAYDRSLRDSVRRRGLPITFITVGLMAIAFMAFAGIQL